MPPSARKELATINTLSLRDSQIVSFRTSAGEGCHIVQLTVGKICSQLSILDVANPPAGRPASERDSRLFDLRLATTCRISKGCEVGLTECADDWGRKDGYGKLKLVFAISFRILAQVSNAVGIRTSIVTIFLYQCGHSTCLCAGRGVSPVDGPRRGKAMPRGAAGLVARRSFQGKRIQRR